MDHLTKTKNWFINIGLVLWASLLTNFWWISFTVEKRFTGVTCLMSVATIFVLVVSIVSLLNEDYK